MVSLIHDFLNIRTIIIQKFLLVYIHDFGNVKLGEIQLLDYTSHDLKNSDGVEFPMEQYMICDEKIS